MTHEAYDLSEYQGSPVELYRIVRGPKVWTLTSGDTDYDYNGETYTPVALTRTKIVDSADLSKSDLEVTLPGTHEVPMMFAPFPPGEVVTLTIFERHWLDEDEQTLPLWTGEVVDCRWDNDAADGVLVCEPLDKGLLQPGLTRTYARNCPYQVFDPDCGLDQNAYRIDGTVQSVNGNQVVVAEALGLPDGWFDGGWLHWGNTEGYTDFRMIGAHAGDTLTLGFYIPGMAPGDAVYLIPGCDRTLDTCWSKYGNGLVYGGWPYRAAKNPFSGDPIF